MASHKKSTVHIADALSAEAQALAAKAKTTLKAPIVEGRQHVVSDRRTPHAPYVLPDLAFGNPRDSRWLEGKSWDEIRALICEDRGR
jgi:hypothetical protein